MSTNSNNISFSEQEITAALHRSAQLAREDGIKHGTGIIVSIDGKVVEITAEELKKQAKLNKESK
jgi:hypothetical protein